MSFRGKNGPFFNLFSWEKAERYFKVCTIKLKRCKRCKLGDFFKKSNKKGLTIEKIYFKLFQKK